MEERLGGGPARGALALVLALAWAAARAADEPRLEFPHAISSLAVSRRRLLVASGNCWYDVEPSLASRGPRHCREAHEGSVNKLLLPLGDGRLLTCWTEPRGSCYLQRVGATDSPPKEFGQELVSCLSRGSAAGTVYHNPGSGWYLVTATTHSLNDSAEQCTPADSAARIAVNIKGEDQVVSEGRQLTMAKENFLFFVDVFLWNKHFFFPYYHYNLSMEPRMLISKQDLSNNDFQFHGQKVLQCDRRTQILSSAYIQERALWVGIFASGKVDLAPTSTALCIFDLSQVVYNLEGCSYSSFTEFIAGFSPDPTKSCDRIAWPVNNATSLSHSNLASVYGIVILNKTVLFLGTGNGQLLKVILDENMEPNCPDILYEIAKETAIFHKLELDPTDEDYIYLPSNNEIRRIQVANCSKHVSCKDCLSAMDPHCGWCHSKTSCTLKGECSFTNNSENWASIVHGTDKCLKIYTSSKPDRGEISVTAVGNSLGNSTCKVISTTTKKPLCEKVNPDNTNCSCHLNKTELIDKVQVLLRSDSWHLSEILEFNACSSQKICSECDRAGCTWNDRENKCVVSSSGTCKRKVDCSKIISASNRIDTLRMPKQLENKGNHRVQAYCASVTCSADDFKEPMSITSIEPAWISPLGKSGVLVIGENFTGSNILMEITGTSSCKPDVISVTEILNHTHMKFCLPPSHKEVKSVCIKEEGFQCSSSKTVHYVSFPECFEILPNISWKSGGRNITIRGKYLNITDTVIILDESGQILTKPCFYHTKQAGTFKSSLGCSVDVLGISSLRKKLLRATLARENFLAPQERYQVSELLKCLKHLLAGQFTCHRSGDECKFTTPALTSEKGTKMANIVLNVEGKHFPCITLQYDPDPQFIHYELTLDLDPELELKIHKQNDNLNITRSEIEVFLSYMDSKERENLTFTVQDILNTKDHSIIHCRTKRKKTSKIDTSSVKVYVNVGKFLHEVPTETLNYTFLYVLLLIPVVIAIAIFVTQRKSKQLHRKLSEHLELLECELRKEIRYGFVELQVEKSDVVDSFGTIPFLDYKHFVLRTFFPEAGGTLSIFMEDSNEPLSGVPNHKDESSIALYALINNKNFLVTLIHTLEKQKTFSVKDRCLFASFLTIALQRNLVYLTNILEVLTRDLMEQSSNVHPKLMLRRTESVVEKLLTNWMSVCLSGFLRETVGEPFYMLVTTLNQRINKGPVDVITCKALYTLNEDWLLWQVTEFSTVVLDVVFEKIQENESEGTTMKIQVNVLDCDTIGQAKEKILQAFLNKNGFPFGLQLSEMGLALQSGTQAKELLDVDSSTVILQDGITKLNTIGHYGILDEATIKVFKKEVQLSDGEYADDYCHLILPDSEAAKETQGAKHTGKQKFKVKEMYLTKLLSTKVAIHSVVEKLFRSIWTLPNNKAPVAIKYFFDFLDAQVENKKITDPDVIHIWKTNSLPLRFWVNILKNPQFVFDIKKTPHIDGCLSVIAQAFMDAFSLSEQQLGKEAPTNKLLYAKDIPLYREEVKAFYKAIKDLPSLSTSELEEFLTQESKKHENEFNEAVALNKIYQYIARYFDEILNKLDKERGLEEAQKQLLNVKDLFDTKKKCKWI